MKYVLLLLLVFGVVNARVHAQREKTTPCPRDSHWMLKYGAPNGHSDTQNERLLDLPCFKATLRRAFPTQHSMLGNNFPLAKLIFNYVAVYGEGPQAFEHRYLVIKGCYPHSCPNAGLIWIDTKSPARIIFAGSDQLTPFSYPGDFHLWVVTTLPDLNQREPLDLPRQFLEAVESAFQTERFISVTVVHHNGAMESVAPALLHVNTSTQVTK